MKTCPICGHRGADGVCPNDGAQLLTATELARADLVDDMGPTQMGSVPPEFEAAASKLPPPRPVKGPPPRPPGSKRPPPSPIADDTQAPKPGPDRKHARAVRPATEEEMRGDDYGKWAEPRMPRKKKKDPMLGRTIAERYEIIGLLGKGGMGAVYKARQPAVQRMVALKVLLQEFAENETVIRRFHQEALAASRLTHPNTISVYDFGQTDDGILYIAMEYLRGQSLAQAQSRGKALPPKRVVHVMRQVCKSLSEAHLVGIIHRDLKPDNIFLVDIQGERDFVKVLDFGVAKLKEFEGKEGTLTQAGMIFGTPKYMSPEQARSGELDRRSDVYALGVILYEMLTGRAPFVGDNPLSILISHVNEHPPHFRDVNPKVLVPPALQAVVFKALNKRREDRHASVDELLIELDAVDKLLDGAPYESVAAQLPGVVPGADGSPSMVGPAIVPEGTDETQRPMEPSGNTVRLDAQGHPVPGSGPPPVVMVDEPPEERLTSGFPYWTIGIALPVLGLGIWLFTQGPSEALTQDAGGAPVSVASAGPTSVESGAAPPSAGTPGTVAPGSVASAAPESAVGKEFMLDSDPSGARIVDLNSGEQVGVTYMRLTVAKKTTYQIRRSGYFTKRITLDPESDQTRVIVDLKPRPEAVKPEAPKTEAPKRVRVARPATVPKRVIAAPRTSADDTIDIE